MTKDILYLFLSLLLFFKDFMYLSLGIRGGGERKRDRNINARDKRWPGASRIRPDQGQDSPPRHVLQLGIEPAAFCFAEQHPTTEPHPSGLYSFQIKLL